MRQPDEENEEFREIFLKKINNQENTPHPLIIINEKSIFGKDIVIGLFSEIRAQISRAIFWVKNDIAHFFSINAADSQKIGIGPIKEIEGRPVIIEKDLFIVFFYCLIKKSSFKNLQFFLIRFSNRNYRCGVRIES